MTDKIFVRWCDWCMKHKKSQIVPYAKNQTRRLCQACRGRCKKINGVYKLKKEGFEPSLMLK